MKTYEDFEKEAASYQSILQRYKTSGTLYEDPSFHPQKKIPERLVKLNPKDHVWNRVDKYYKSPLFENIDKDAVKQGSLGDCYFISSLSRIAKQKELVKLLFDSRSDIKSGAVIVYLYAFGRRTPILIDTLLPFKRGTRIPLFSHPSDIHFSPWFTLVEKAFAKLNGAYSNIDGGNLPAAIYSLFGYFPRNKQVSAIKGSPFEKLMKLQRMGAVIGSAIYTSTKASPDEIIDNGLINGHSYLIMKARTAEGKNFVCLRNPWGDHEWLGDWSDTSELWTESLKKSLGVKFKNDGSFWMIDKDFFKYFSVLEVSRPINPEWHCRSFHTQLKPGPHDGRQYTDAGAKLVERDTFGFKIESVGTVKLYIRLEKRASPDYESSNVQIVLCRCDGKRITPELFRSSNRVALSSKSDITGFSMKVEKPSEKAWSVCVLRTSAMNAVEDVYIQLYCEKNFTLFNVDTPNVLIPEDQKTGVLFDNSSVRHPNVAPTLKVKKIDGIDLQVLASLHPGQMQNMILQNTNDDSEDENDDDISAMPQPLAARNRREAPKASQEILAEDQNLRKKLEEERKKMEAEMKKLEDEKKKMEIEKKRIETEKKTMEAAANAAAKKKKEEEDAVKAAEEKRKQIEAATAAAVKKRQEEEKAATEAEKKRKDKEAEKLKLEKEANELTQKKIAEERAIADFEKKIKDKEAEKQKLEKEAAELEKKRLSEEKAIEETEKRLKEKQAERERLEKEAAQYFEKARRQSAAAKDIIARIKKEEEEAEQKKKKYEEFVIAAEKKRKEEEKAAEDAEKKRKEQEAEKVRLEKEAEELEKKHIALSKESEKTEELRQNEEAMAQSLQRRKEEEEKIKQSIKEAEEKRKLIEEAVRMAEKKRIEEEKAAAEAEKKRKEQEAADYFERARRQSAAAKDIIERIRKEEEAIALAEEKRKKEEAAAAEAEKNLKSKEEQKAKFEKEAEIAVKLAKEAEERRKLNEKAAEDAERKKIEEEAAAKIAEEKRRKEEELLEQMMSRRKELEAEIERLKAEAKELFLQAQIHSDAAKEVAEKLRKDEEAAKAAEMKRRNEEAAATAAVEKRQQYEMEAQKAEQERKVKEAEKARLEKEAADYFARARKQSAAAKEIKALLRREEEAIEEIKRRRREEEEKAAEIAGKKRRRRHHHRKDDPNVLKTTQNVALDVPPAFSQPPNEYTNLTNDQNVSSSTPIKKRKKHTAWLEKEKREEEERKMRELQLNNTSDSPIKRRKYCENSSSNIAETNEASKNESPKVQKQDDESGQNSAAPLPPKMKMIFVQGPILLKSKKPKA